RPLWQLRVGVKLYDLLCGGENFQPSRGLSADETRRALPALKADGLRDALRSAARAGATLANYTRFLDARRDGDLWSCQLEDTRSGNKFPVRARAIVNATGPWAPLIPHSAVQLRLTKGIHVVVDRARLPIGDDAVVISEGRRLLFVIPWGRSVIVGTTDTDYH